MTWREDAVCRTVDPELFYPERVIKGVLHPRAQVADAKAVCARCPVKTQCLTEALKQPEQGIWGGTTEKERDLIRREKGIKYPSGWAARKPMSRWEEDYHRLADAGFTQMQIWRSQGTRFSSFVAQLRRYGIPRSHELEMYSYERLTGTAI